jgi:hypothetical protein
MAFNKKFFTTGGIVASSGACFTENVNPFTGTSNDNGKALYSLDYDSSDTSGTFNGEPYNGVNFGVSGKINTGARFNGTNQFIKLGTDVFKYTDVTISAFINPNLSDTNVKTIFGNTSYINGQQFHGIIISVRNDGSSDKIYVQHYPSSTAVYSTASISLNTFTHIAVSYTGSQTKIYINGTLDSTHSASLSYSGSQTLTASLGAYILQNYTANTTYDEFSGTIDQVRVFSSILDGTKISTLAAEKACVHTSTTDIVDFPPLKTNAAYFKMDNSAKDEVSGNIGSDTNVQYRFGKYNQSAFFNDTGIINTGFTRSGTSFSVSLWLNLNDNGTRQIVLGDGNTNGSDSSITFSAQVDASDDVVIYVNNSQSSGNNNTVVSYSGKYNKWTHFVVTLNGTSGAVYLDNTKTTFTTDRSLGTAAQAFGIGSWSVTASNGGETDGFIDQVRFYNAELSDSNVESLYNEKPETDTSNFKTVLYTGNNTTGHFINNVGMDLETDGGLVWIKSRNDAAGDNHILQDNVRGVSNFIMSSSQAAESPSDMVTSFEKTGFFLGADTPTGVNTNNIDFVAWVWKGGGTPVSTNNNGGAQITADVSANTAAGFSIVKYTGSGTVNQTVYHGLNQAPELIINKQTGAVENWFVFTTVIDGSNDFIVLNDSAGKGDSTLSLPTTDYIYSRTSGTMINYCFHSVAGYQKIGSYAGTGLAGNAQDVGFKPSFVIIKRTTDTESWFIFDTRRPDKRLEADSSNSENTDVRLNLTSTGFDFDGNVFNESSNTYIYLAIK